MSYNNKFGAVAPFNNAYHAPAYAPNNFANHTKYKKSGAKFTLITRSETGKTNGMTIVNAWKSSSQGLIKITVKPYERCKGGDTCEWQKALAEVVNTNTGQISTFPTLINVTTKRVIIKELGWLITSAGHGISKSGKHISGSVVRLTKK